MKIYTKCLGCHKEIPAFENCFFESHFDENGIVVQTNILVFCYACMKKGTTV